MAAETPGTLFVAATPLGNLGDISHRLVDTLGAAHLVLAEDTRRARSLLSHLGLHVPLESLHAHNERQRTQGLVERLQAGAQVVLVSDAGTPAISDPGAFLVAAAHAAGVRVCPIAGPSALAVALSAAGFAHETADALFVGFLPRAGRARRQAVAQMLQFAGVVVLFESPFRTQATLAELAALAPQRPACLCRELTKLHEQILRQPLVELEATLAAQGPLKGEVTLVLGPSAPADAGAAQTAARRPADGAAGWDAPALSAALTRCLAAGLSVRDAVTAVASISQAPRRQVYRLALADGAGAAGSEET